MCICFGNGLAPPRSGLNLLVAGPSKQSPVNRLVPCSRPVLVDEFTASSKYRTKLLADQFRNDVRTVERVWIQIWHVVNHELKSTRMQSSTKLSHSIFPAASAGFGLCASCQLRAIVTRERASQTCVCYTWCLALCMHQVALARP